MWLCFPDLNPVRNLGGGALSRGVFMSAVSNLYPKVNFEWQYRLFVKLLLLKTFLNKLLLLTVGCFKLLKRMGIIVVNIIFLHFCCTQLVMNSFVSLCWINHWLQFLFILFWHTFISWSIQSIQDISHKQKTCLAESLRFYKH